MLLRSSAARLSQTCRREVATQNSFRRLPDACDRVVGEVSIMTSVPLDTTELIEICRRNDVSMLGVFGSVARGEATAQSDVDLLVKFSKGKSLLAVVSLERQMSEALGRRVDLLTEGDLSPYLRSRILRDVRVIYDAG